MTTRMVAVVPLQHQLAQWAKEAQVAPFPNAFVPIEALEFVAKLVREVMDVSAGALFSGDTDDVGARLSLLRLAEAFEEAAK
jgi:hypothetical protein